MPDKEIYEGAAIKDIVLHGSLKYPSHICIRLTNGKYLEINPHIVTSKQSISAQLEVSRGGWFG
jgi:hypothetical protein